MRVDLVHLVSLVQPNNQIYKRDQPVLEAHAPWSVALAAFSESGYWQTGAGRPLDTRR
jgi:hypothetical protein